MRTHAQLKYEAKRAVLAMARNGVVGVIIYQPHQKLPGVLEIKNISVRPDVRGRHIASVLLRNAEFEAVQDYGVREALVDAKVKNLGIRKYLLTNGYRPLWAKDLYRLGAGEDVLFRKSLSILRRSYDGRSFQRTGSMA
jgi:ribosomal protein S18 acetylase RimI-like enzyme